MNKSILVIDTPKCCRECPCHFTDMVGIEEDGKERFFRFLCGASNREIAEKVNTDRQDWCPLQDVPKKKTRISPFFDENYINGRNDCINEILKGEK